MVSLCLLLLAGPAAARALAAPAAVTYTVDTALDLVDGDTTDGVCAPGNCSLRAAIMQANVITAPAITIIVPAGTYTLTRPAASGNGAENGDLNLTAPTSGNPVISLIGQGAATTIINANQIDRVLAISATRTVEISGLTLRNGFRMDPGGGVFNLGTLSITDAVIEDSQTDAGGGGIFSPGTLHLTRSTIRSNAAYIGGGIWLHGLASIRDSTISGNSAGWGGGIEVSAYPTVSQVTIVNSTISLNSADTNGGGIDSEGAIYLYNVSVIDNDADHDRDMQGGVGGGVYANSGSVFVVVNSLIARNTIFNAPIYDDCNGTLTGYGWNLLGELTGCTFGGNGNASRGVIALDMFGALQANGGATQTHALLAGSAAIDSTFGQGCVNETAAALPADQRGSPRGSGLACDVGAYEYQPPLYLPLVLR